MTNTKIKKKKNYKYILLYINIIILKYIVDKKW